VEHAFDSLDGLHKFTPSYPQPSTTNYIMSPSEDFDAAASYLSNASSLSQVSTAIKLEVLGCPLRLANSGDSDHLVLSTPTAVWVVQICDRIAHAQHFEAGDI